MQKILWNISMISPKIYFNNFTQYEMRLSIYGKKLLAANFELSYPPKTCLPSKYLYNVSPITIWHVLNWHWDTFAQNQLHIYSTFNVTFGDKELCLLVNYFMYMKNHWQTNQMNCTNKILSDLVFIIVLIANKTDQYSDWLAIHWLV